MFWLLNARYKSEINITRKKTMNLIINRKGFALFFFILWNAFGIFAQENTIKSRAERWQEDVEFFARELPKRHKNLFFKLSKTEFEREIERIKTNLPKFSDTQIHVELMTLTAKIGDAHTTVDNPGSTTSIFPLAISRFKEGWYVLLADEKYKEIVGAKLVKVGDTPIEKVVRKVSEVIPAENEYWLMSNVSIYLQMGEVLQAKGILPTKESGSFSFVTREGKPLTINMKSIMTKDLRSAKFAKITDQIKPSFAAQKNDIYWSEYLPEKKTLFIAYNRCVEDKNKPFVKFVEEAFAVVDKEKAEKIVVDLRRNGGGNSNVMQPLLEAIKARPQFMKKGSLFVLIGRGTFSSGFMNARELQFYTNAIWVGEPSGQKPNAYGEVREFVLPNSNLKVSYSTKFFELVKAEKRSFLPVDVPVERRFVDFTAGRDLALEKALDYR